MTLENRDVIGILLPMPLGLRPQQPKKSQSSIFLIDITIKNYFLHI